MYLSFLLLFKRVFFPANGPPCLPHHSFPPTTNLVAFSIFRMDYCFVYYTINTGSTCQCRLSRWNTKSKTYVFVYRFSDSYDVVGIVFGPDSDCWFTKYNKNKAGHFTGLIIDIYLGFLFFLYYSSIKMCKIHYTTCKIILRKLYFKKAYIKSHIRTAWNT